MIAEYKINRQKLVAFIYTNNEISEREYKETMPFKITTTKIKSLGIKLS